MHRERGDNEDNQGDEQLIRSNNYPAMEPHDGQLLAFDFIAG